MSAGWTVEAAERIRGRGCDTRAGEQDLRGGLLSLGNFALRPLQRWGDGRTTETAEARPPDPLMSAGWTAEAAEGIRGRGCDTRASEQDLRVGPLLLGNFAPRPLQRRRDGRSTEDVEAGSSELLTSRATCTHWNRRSSIRILSLSSSQAQGPPEIQQGRLSIWAQ